MPTLRDLPDDMIPSIALGALLTALLARLLEIGAGWATAQVVAGLAGYALLSLAVAGAAWRLDAARFGHANRLTLLRAGLVCLAGGALWAGGQTPHHDWSLATLVASALLLDALDGRIARRRGETSRFGARFDLEVDALLLLILALLVWHSGQAGVWVLAIGLMRYAFVLAGLAVPALRRPLAPSRRRQAVCALQGIALVVCLLPPVAPDLASGIAGGALIVLAWSFAIDARRLMARRGSDLNAVA